MCDLEQFLQIQSYIDIMDEPSTVLIPHIWNILRTEVFEGLQISLFCDLIFVVVHFDVSIIILTIIIITSHTDCNVATS